MTGLLAQAQPDPDLTVPIAVIVACAVVIVLTLAIQWFRGRRQEPSAGPGDPLAPQ